MYDRLLIVYITWATTEREYKILPRWQWADTVVRSIFRCQSLSVDRAVWYCYAVLRSYGRNDRAGRNAGAGRNVRDETGRSGTRPKIAADAVVAHLNRPPK